MILYDDDDMKPIDYVLLHPICVLSHLMCAFTKNKKRKTKHAVSNAVISMEHEILGDTDLEAIINNFACKEMRRHDIFRS